MSWLKKDVYCDVKDIDSLKVSSGVKKKLKIFHKHASLLKVNPSQNDLKTMDIGKLLSSMCEERYLTCLLWEHLTEVL